MLFNNPNSKKERKIEKFIGWLRLNHDNIKDIISGLFKYQIIEFI